jgi:hypothetical protein
MIVERHGGQLSRRQSTWITFSRSSMIRLPILVARKVVVGSEETIYVSRPIRANDLFDAVWGTKA